MWKRSFTFLLVLAVLVSSVWCYPSWVYGKTKESLVTEPVPSEAQEAEEKQEAEEQSAPSPQAKKLQTEDSKDSLRSLEASVKGLTEDEATAAELSNYIDTVNDGIKVMEAAYKEEVEYAKSVEKKYNALAEAYANDVGKDYKKSILKDFSVTVNPFVVYSPKNEAWGIGGNVGFGFKNISLSVGVIKPQVTAWEDFQNFDDMMVSAGIAFTI